MRTLEWYWQIYGHNKGVVIPRYSSIWERVTLSVPRDHDRIRAADPIGAGSVMGRTGCGVFWVPGSHSCEALLSNNLHVSFFIAAHTKALTIAGQGT